MRVAMYTAISSTSLCRFNLVTLSCIQSGLRDHLPYPHMQWKQLIKIKQTKKKTRVNIAVTFKVKSDADNRPT